MTVVVDVTCNGYVPYYTVLINLLYVILPLNVIYYVYEFVSTLSIVVLPSFLTTNYDVLFYVIVVYPLTVNVLFNVVCPVTVNVPPNYVYFPD